MARSRRFSIEKVDLDFLLEPCGVHLMEERLQGFESQFLYLVNQANDLQAHLVRSRSRFPKEAFVHVVPTFLDQCQPYFTYLEFKARSYRPRHRPVPINIRNRLLRLTQKLCLHLERLILLYASYNILSTDESDPCGFSHFYIGRCMMGPFQVSMFRYCQPAPFLADGEKGPTAGLYKRMRWNVQRSKEYQEHDRNSSEEPKYYFMCYEDVPKVEKWCEKLEDQGSLLGGSVRFWFLGQWVQTDPASDDMFDWALCKKPKGLFKVLRALGPDEPAVSQATDLLLGVLFGAAF